jgi:hypothetical protein
VTAYRYHYKVSNWSDLIEWLTLNCSPEVGDAVIRWVQQMCIHPHAWPPEGTPRVGKHPQTKVTVVRMESEGVGFGNRNREVVALEYLIIDEKTDPPIPDEELGTIRILHHLVI